MLAVQHLFKMSSYILYSLIFLLSSFYFLWMALELILPLVNYWSKQRAQRKAWFHISSQLLLGSAVVPLDFAKNNFVQDRNKALCSDFLLFFFVWNPGLAQFLSLPQAFSNRAKSRAKAPELVNNLVQTTFSIQSLRQSINMEDSLYLVDFFLVCIFLWRKGHCASVTFSPHKRQLCVCPAPVAAIHNTACAEKEPSFAHTEMCFHFFSISDQLQRCWQHVEEEVWCITHYAETNMALYLVLSTEQVPRPWGDYQKSSNMETCMDGKGGWTAGEHSVLVLYRESRDLIMSAKTVLWAH